MQHRIDFDSVEYFSPIWPSTFTSNKMTYAQAFKHAPFPREAVFGNEETAHDRHPPGSAMKNVVPCPGSESSQIRPPCRSTMTLTIVRPIPVPPPN